jgi:hypothetical protein
MHDLHVAVGDILRTLESPNVRVLLDKACGGGKPLLNFYGTGDVCLTQVDAAIVVNEQVKAVIEIEETDIRPLVLCGKIMITVVSKYCVWNQNKFPLSASVFFIQIFKKKNEDKDWSKYDQCRYLENEILKCLQPGQSRIARYAFHFGTADEYRTDGSHGQELLQEIQAFLNANPH